MVKEKKAEKEVAVTQEKKVKKEKTAEAIYSKPVALNSELQRHVKIAKVTDYGFAKQLNSSVLTGYEFFEAAKYYPIAFSKTPNEEIMLVAILGVADNAFTDEQGKWKEGFYIPAFIRRYPYIPAKTDDKGDGNLLVAVVDSAYKGFDAEEGDRLFDDEGKNTPALDRAVEFLKAYNAQFEVTKQFVNRLKELELFAAVDANIKLADGTSYVMRNLLVVDEAKMLKLDDKQLLSLTKMNNNQRGYIAWIYAHIFSLNNFVKVINK